MKKRYKFILFWIFLTISFSMLAAVLILEAYGYRFNRDTWKLESTGVILLDGQPRQVKVTVNGKANEDITLPVRLPKLLPGQYEISIGKTDYQTWTKTLSLSGGQAIDEDKIQLFYANPKITESTKRLTLKELQSDFKSQSSNIEVKNNEIWYDEKLVTRFSQKPLGVILTNDRNHFIFQLNKELGVIELDGTNYHKLAALPGGETIAFALYADKLVYASGGKIFEADIR